MVETLVQHYGPIAFGLVALMALWMTIVRPEMSASRESAKVQASALVAVGSEMRAAADANRSAAEMNKAAAVTLAAAIGVLAKEKP